MNPEHAQVLIARAEKDCGAIFAQIDANEERNTQKVLRAFRRHEIAARHFAPTTGYGYDDIGRTALEALFCDVLGCEAALVRRPGKGEKNPACVIRHFAPWRRADRRRRQAI